MSKRVEIAWLRFEVARLRRQNQLLSEVLQQTRRDCDLLAAGWRDPRAALSFIRDRHRISDLEEAK